MPPVLDHPDISESEIVDVISSDRALKTYLFVKTPLIDRNTKRVLDEDRFAGVCQAAIGYVKNDTSIEEIGFLPADD